MLETRSYSYVLSAQAKFLVSPLWPLNMSNSPFNNTWPLPLCPPNALTPCTLDHEWGLSYVPTYPGHRKACQMNTNCVTSPGSRRFPVFLGVRGSVWPRRSPDRIGRRATLPTGSLILGSARRLLSRRSRILEGLLARDRCQLLIKCMDLRHGNSFGGGGGDEGCFVGPDVHLTTIRTLDIKLATLLQTLASAPDCPKVGSADFGERLTVVQKTSVSWASKLVTCACIGFGTWPGLLGTTGRRGLVRSRVRFDVLRARKRSSERMHIALRMRMTTSDGR